jgi:hypothetical protein
MEEASPVPNFGGVKWRLTGLCGAVGQLFAHLWKHLE